MNPAPSLFRLLAGFVLAAALSVSAQSLSGVSAQQKVSAIEIRHVGPRTVSDAFILGQIRVKNGDVFQRTAVDEDIRALYRTGLFYNIRVAEAVTNSTMRLTYVVQSRPRLTEVKMVGHSEYSENRLKKKISSKVGEPLDEQKLFKDARAIQEYYEKNGYPRTTVKSSVNIDEASGRGTAMFEIVEGGKIKIQRVEFPGVSAFTQKKLRKEIKTRDRWWMSWLTGSGVYKEEQLLEDRERLAEFYRSKGYIDFELKQVETEYPRTNKMVLRFHVYEGRQYKVGAITFKGTTMFPTNQLDQFKLKPGAVFAPSDLRKDMEKVEDFYGAKGHIEVAPGAGLRVRRIANTESGTMDLEYNVEEGQKSFVEKIDIRGNTKTKDRVVRRELAISPGETFDMVRVKMSKKRLEGLGYFSKVETRPEDDPTLPTNRKNLIVGVEEKNTGNISVGAGFSSVDELVGFAEYSQGNFDLMNPPSFQGDGQKLRLRMQLGTERQDYIITFVEPWFLGRKIKFETELYHRDLDFQSFDDIYTETRTGGKFSLSKPFWSDYFIGSINYTLEQVGIDLNQGYHGDIETVSIVEGRPVVTVNPRNVPQAILDEEGDTLVSKIGITLAYDTRNSVLLPDAGQRTSFTAETASSALGGERDYYSLELRSAWFIRGLRKGHVLELTGRTGVTEGYSGDTVPFYDRFYLGGLYSLRGFKYREISPREPGFDEPIGGGTFVFGSAEYSVPVVEQEKGGAGIRFAVFYDYGFVNADAYEFSNKSYSDNWGIGLRLNLPIGPLRLDYAIPINHDQYSDGDSRFQFGVGYTREF
jgi:outer membrane protein insertion porin family